MINKLFFNTYLIIGIISFVLHIYISFFLSKSCSWNEGIALGLDLGLGSNILSAIQLMLLFVMVIFLLKSFSKLKKNWQLIFILTISSLGNVIDRLWHGAICDYISIYKLPIFNTNDIFILTSLIFIFLIIYNEEILCRRGKSGS